MNVSQTSQTKSPAARPIPFDVAKLDALLDQAGIDVLIASSKHNIQYLLGGYRFFFYDHFDAIGISRYLPLLVYPKGDPGRAVYIGHPMERYEKELGKFWVPTIEASVRATFDAMEVAAGYVKKLPGKPKTIGVERAFLPADAEEVLKRELPEARVVEAHLPLERLRSVKTPEELDYLRAASDRVIESMMAVIAGHGPGATKNELVQALKREEVARELTFEYCLITAGTSLNRAPSDQVWGEGDILSIDSGGNYKGYIGDLCRMAIQGEPDAELIDMLAEIDAVQQAARGAVRQGARGGDVIAAGEEALGRSPYGNTLHFVAHGMGLISHEAPRLTNRSTERYPAYDAELPLQAGMILSIETTLPHPKRGFVKLEDTVAVTAGGYEAFGDVGRGWNRGGTAKA